MREVYPDIFLIEEKGKFALIKPPENIYVLAGENGLIFDAGYGNRKVIKQVITDIEEIRLKFEAQGRKFNLTRIIPSHWHPDHSSGLISLRDKLGVKVLMTKQTEKILKNKKSFRSYFEPQDVQEEMLSIRNRRRRIRDRMQRFMFWRFYRRLYGLSLGIEADEIITPNSEISINGENWLLFPSPGHACDHLSLYNEDKGVLFSGDNILRSITTWLGPPDCDLDEYIRSVKEIYNLLNLKLILSAHGSPITEPKKRIKDILDHREKRKEEVLELVNGHSEDGISPSRIIHELYGDSPMMIKNAARGWICLTLHALEEERLIKRKIRENVISFFPANH